MGHRSDGARLGDGDGAAATASAGTSSWAHTTSPEARETSGNAAAAFAPGVAVDQDPAHDDAIMLICAAEAGAITSWVHTVDGPAAIDLIVEACARWS